MKSPASKPWMSALLPVAGHKDLQCFLTHKESGIKNDPNDWSEEVGNPGNILDLLLSIINVSMQTVQIVAGLPKLKFEG